MKTRIIFYILILAVFINCEQETYNINDFQRSYFKIITANKGFYQVEAGLENVKDEIIIYNGYVNDDLYTDIVTVNKQRDTANFYIYNNESGHFKNLSSSTKLEDEKILQVNFISINEINDNKWPNVVIVSYKEQENGINTIFRGYSFEKSSDSERFLLKEKKSFYFENLNSKSKEIQEPFSFQLYQGDEIVNYFLMMKDGKRILYYYDIKNNKIVNQNFSDIIMPDCEGCLDPKELDGSEIPPVYTSGFVDINRDCKSDIIIESVKNGDRFLDFFIYKGNKFAYIKSVPIPKSYSLGSFEDVNQNNTPDLVFFDNENKDLKIFLSDFSMNVPKSISSFCLDSADTRFSYSSLENKDKNVISQYLGDKFESLTSEEDLRVFPLLRFGDIDLDGYRDLIMDIKSKDKSSFIVFHNVECDETKKEIINGMDSNLCRFFEDKFITDEMKRALQLQSIQTSFFDFGERGKLGFFILHKEENKLKISAFLNNFEIENYFLKAIGFINKNQYQNIDGATFAIKKTELDGNSKIITRTQNKNSSFNKLNLPFVHFGLAKINNYIEDFSIHVNRINESSKSWTPIIPNSQLIVYFSPGNSSEWDLNIFINPTSAMLFIFISTVVVLLLIGFIILYLHCQEKKIDRKFRINDFNIL